MELCNCNNTAYIIYDIAQIDSFDKTHTDTRSSVMSTGKNSRGFKYRILIKFNFNHLPKNAQILRASLCVYVLNTAPICNTHNLIAYTLDSDWDISTVNWNNQPSIDFTNKLFEKSVDKWEKYSFDLTCQAGSWYKYPYTNYGMILIGSDELYYNKIQICTEQGSANNLSLLVEYCVGEEIHVVAPPTQFFQYPEDIIVSPGIEYFTAIRDISLTKTVSYFVKNNNSAAINVVFEYSPDGVNFMKEDRIISIAPGTNQVLLPLWFSKYTRLSITVSTGGNTAAINTWLQLQV